MQILRVAYNFGCRDLYNLPWRASFSSHQVQCNIPTRAGFTYRLYRLKPRASRSKGTSNKRIESMVGIWSFTVDQNSSKIYVLIYSRNLVLFNFRGDNARVFQRVPMNLNMAVGQTACQLLCRYTQSTLAATCVFWIVPIVMCDSIKRTCGCSCLKCTWSVAVA